MPKRLIIMIQARLGSSRLPGKVLKPILGRPVLWHIINRLRRVKKADEIVVATSVQPNDDPIEGFCASENIRCFRGDESDVLDRFYKAAVFFDATTLIRITGDCPLIDPTIIDDLIDFFFKGQYDHCGIAIGPGVDENKRQERFPDGLDAEIFSMKALATSWNEAVGDEYREHVTPFMWKNSQRFKIGAYKRTSGEGDISFFRWTLDYEADYRLITWIYEQLFPQKKDFGMHDILDLASRCPEKFKSNQHAYNDEYCK